VPKKYRKLALSVLVWVNSCGNATTTPDLLDAKGLLTDVTSPAILSPAPSGGGRAPNLTAKLIWATKIPAKYYEVEVTSDAAYQNPISGSPFRVVAPTTELTINLPDAVRYYWRVRTNYNSPGVWSNGYFDAMNSSVHVFCPQASATCDDAGQSGNKSHPFRTISGALAYARSTTVSDILVAHRGGTASYNDTMIVISGVNLKGGYTATFLEADRSMTDANKARVAYSGTVLFALNIIAATTVEGFNMIATGTASTIALVAGSDNNLTLQYNRIETTVAQPGPSYGVLVQNSGTSHATGPLVAHNAIVSGNVATAGSTTAAIRLENSTPRIRNNYVKSGTIVQGITDFLSLSAGILSTNSDPLAVNNVIVANTISGGNFAWSIGVYHFSANGGMYSNNTIATLSSLGNTYALAINGGTGKPLLTNNILFNAAGGSVFYEWNSADNPVSLHNNAFIGDSGGIHYSNSGGTAIRSGNANLANINSSAATNGGAAATVAGNITPLSNSCIPFINYAGDDWRLQQNSCSASEWRDLRYGGRDTNAANCGTGSTDCGGVTNDLNATARTAINSGASPLTNAAGYSMGAYEQD